MGAKPIPQPKPKLQFLSLPPDIVLKILGHLPITDLAQMSSVSRRCKILVNYTTLLKLILQAYTDSIYEPKLCLMGVSTFQDESKHSLEQLSNSVNGNKSLAESFSASILSQKQKTNVNIEQSQISQKKDFDQVGDLSNRLKQLPGGHLLPVGKTYLETGTIWGGVGEETEEVVKESSEGDEKMVDSGIIVLEPVLEGNNTISSALPDLKSAITIGSGGLKGLEKPSAGLKVGGGMKKSPSTYRTSSNQNNNPSSLATSARDAFKIAFIQLKPYFLDFKTRQRDSKLFKDFKDLTELAAMLRKLKSLGNSKIFFDIEDINFSLSTTIEWFESMVLGKFESAYDKNDFLEMRKNAEILFQLRKGDACVQLFISKNPIFFDETYNPSLVASKLPTATTGPQGFALADDFAKFIQHLLTNVKSQISLIAQVFQSENCDTLTQFVNKVFEDSISEYLHAVLTTSRERDGIKIYLHTLASSIHSCLQFIDFLGKNREVSVDTDDIKTKMAKVFKQYTDNFISIEVDYLEYRFQLELDKLKNAKKAEVKPDKKPVSKGWFGSKAKEELSSDKGLPQSPTKKIDDAVTYQLLDNSLNSQISLEFCIHILQMNKETLGRVLVITAATEIEKIKSNVEKVFVPLLKVVGQQHIQKAFDFANQRLDQVHHDDQDSLQFFELIHIADLIAQMLEVYYQEDVKPWIDEEDFLSEIVMEKKAFTRLLDNAIASGMDKSIQVLILQTEAIMMKEQLVNDFNPPETQIFDMKPTKACLKIIQVIGAHTTLLASVTDKHTMEIFGGEIGTRLFSVIIKSIKAHKVSQIGAMQLICDMNTYYEWASGLRVAAVKKLYSVLKELGNLFLADGGDELRKLVHDTQMYQGALRLEEVLEILGSRTDYKKIQKYMGSEGCYIQ